MAKENDEEQSSGSENIRRVYALPAEMVDRITAFQRDRGLASEVEAVRRLLDEALKSRDNLETLINRTLAHLGQTRIAADAAREVLVGHPLVKSISFGEDSISFVVKTNGGGYGVVDEATVYENGIVQLPNSGDYSWKPRKKDEPYLGGRIYDDAEIPF